MECLYLDTPQRPLPYIKKMSCLIYSKCVNSCTYQDYLIFADYNTLKTHIIINTALSLLFAKKHNYIQNNSYKNNKKKCTDTVETEKGHNCFFF